MTSKAKLRDVIADDLEIFFEDQRDPEGIRMAAFLSRDKDTFMAHWKKILADPAIIKKTILFEGLVAGNIVCFEESEKPLIGYWIGKTYWGKGVATQALGALLGQVEIRPLYAYVAKHNVASFRVLEKCGFKIYSEENDELMLQLEDREAGSQSLNDAA